MDDAAIKTQIDRPEYVGMSRFDIAAAINAEDVPDAAPLDRPGVEACLVKRGKWAKISLTADAKITATDDAKIWALTFMLDPVTADLSMGVALGLLDAADLAALGATRIRKRWQLVGERELDHGDIIRANGQSWDDYIVKAPGTGHVYDPILVALKTRTYKDTYAASLAAGKISSDATKDADAAVAALLQGP